MTRRRQAWGLFGLVLGFLAGPWALAKGPGAKTEAPPWIGAFTARRVVTASSPDNNFSVLTSLYRSAKKSIHISVYQLDNPEIGEVLEEALARGVSVKILLEGAPIPKLPQSELYIASRLVKKGAKVHFYDIAEGRSSRDFKYFHAKYSIVDGQRVSVGSANFGNNGHPVDASAGNREWEVVLEDETAAEMFEAAFQHDAGIDGAWAAYGSSDRYKLEDPNYKPEPGHKSGNYELDLKPVQAFDVPVYTVFAPDNSLDEAPSESEHNGPVLRTMRATKSTLDIEQLNFETYWGDKPYNRGKEESPMMRSILDLAKAGKQIRILLNDDMVFHDPERHGLFPSGFFSEEWANPVGVFADLLAEPSGSSAKAPRDNKATLTYLNKIAKRDNLNVEVRLLNFRDCGLGVLHNKGMIVDGMVAMVGSLNWGESAIKFNRETAVLLKNKDVAKYYTKAFEYDWKCSAHGSRP